MENMVPNFSISQNTPRLPLLPADFQALPPELLTQQAWGGQALESAFITSSPVMLMLLVPGPHFGNCCFGGMTNPKCLRWALLHVEHQAPCLHSSSHLHNGASMMGSWHSGRAIPTPYDLPRGPGRNTLLGAQGTVLWLCPLGLCGELLSFCTQICLLCTHYACVHRSSSDV